MSSYCCSWSPVRQVVRTRDVAGFKGVETIARLPTTHRYLAGKQLVAKAASDSSRAGNSSRSKASDGFGATPDNPFTTRGRPLTYEELQSRLEKLPELLQEISRIVLSTGPRGAFRGIQAAQAVMTVAAEVLQQSQSTRGAADIKPEVVLRKLFEQLGATYIKLGQFIASSPTLFPPEYVEEFQKCLDKTEPVPFSDIKRTISEELKQPLESVFASIDPKPLASASVAQVHAAVLAGSNQQVVVKVLKPGVEDVLTTDLSFIYIAARVLEFISPDLARTSLSAIVGDVRTSMLDEVDFNKEASHVQEFALYLDRTGMRDVATCPYVYRDLTSKRVLTMERLYGVPLTDLDSIRSLTRGNPEETLIAALNTWFGSVVGADTFHADVHAGNLLVLNDGRVGFIDFGIVGRISPVTWKAVEALLVSTTTGDYDTMARALVTMGATDGDVDITRFSRDLEKIFKEIESIDSDLVVSPAGGNGSPAGFQAQVTVDDTQVNRLLIEVIRVGEENGIRFPREFGLLLKQLLYFDRYTQILAPGLQVFSDSRVDLASGEASARF
uniref:AarF domain-containing kinase n=1 Tax=Tetraselmis sp. GSL018 TaxID=582737 RepID=A0A061R0W3_9CHLO